MHELKAADIWMTETVSKRVVLFGTGSAALDFLSVAPANLRIACLIDNDPAKHGASVSG